MLFPGAVPHRVLTPDPIDPPTDSLPVQTIAAHYVLYFTSFVFVLSALQLPLSIQKCAVCMQWRHGIRLHHNIVHETLTLEYVY